MNNNLAEINLFLTVIPIQAANAALMIPTTIKGVAPLAIAVVHDKFAANFNQIVPKTKVNIVPNKLAIKAFLKLKDVFSINHPIKKAVGRKPTRYPPVGPTKDEIPPDRPEKTGIPAEPINK